MTRYERHRGRPLLGGLVVLVGVVLLVETTGAYDLGDLRRFLPSLLVLFGLYRLVAGRLRHLFWPLAFVAVGAGWQLVELGVLTGARAWDYWPVLVVIFGVSLVAAGARSRSWSRGRTVDLREGGAFEQVAVFADLDRAVEGDFRHGDVSAVVGDVRLDLREATPDGPGPATLDVAAVVGDVDVVVPADWAVDVETVGVLGDVRDRRRARPGGDPDLVVEGVAVLGDVTVRD